MRNVTHQNIDRSLDFSALVEALHDAFAQAGQTPPRHHHEIGTGPNHATHLLMPAWTPGVPGDGFIGTKIVDVFPGNRAKGLPAVSGVYVLQSGETGAPLAVMDGTRLTLWRTAAASALAARFLARPDAQRLLIVGAGALAPFLARGHCSVRPIDRVSVWNRRSEAAEVLAARLRQEAAEVEVARDLEAAVRDADIVSCATLASEPIVRGAWLKQGSHLDLVGAFNLGMREADDEALRRARVYVDTPSALSEGGDVALGLRNGAIRPDHVVGDLHALCRGTVRGRESAEEITLFKSVGASLEDLAAAMLVWKRLDAGET